MNSIIEATIAVPEGLYEYLLTDASLCEVINTEFSRPALWHLNDFYVVTFKVLAEERLEHELRVSLPVKEVKKLGGKKLAKIKANYGDVAIIRG
jgi:hypothetical protein